MNDPWDLVTRNFAARFGDRSAARGWFVPGRIEVFGKHVDYAGGRSLLAAIDRGFFVLARPRRDAQVHIVDARFHQSYSGIIDADLPQARGTWSDYVVTVLRRMARDFPGATVGMDAVIGSTLPSAAGLSSSTALVIASFLPLAAFNRLEARAEWAANLASTPQLAGYLGAVENGRAFGTFAADFGVGTQGGAQDHLAILACRQNHLSQARHLPATIEAEVAFPSDWCFVIASCGVPAPKGSRVQERYNALARQTSTLIGAWNSAHDTEHHSLLDVLTSDPDAVTQLIALVRTSPVGPLLVDRLHQFREETLDLIPAAVAALRAQDATAFGAAVTRSHHIGNAALNNQIDETRHLADRAVALGAYGASAFGAGFGGSVFAVVAREEAETFRKAWQADYRARFVAVADRAEFFLADPADGAREVTGSATDSRG